MPHGTDPDAAAFRVRWPNLSGPRAWLEVIEPPRIDEGCLVLKTAPERLLWVPLHTVSGPIEVEAM